MDREYANFTVNTEQYRVLRLNQLQSQLKKKKGKSRKWKLRHSHQSKTKEAVSRADETHQMQMNFLMTQPLF